MSWIASWLIENFLQAGFNWIYAKIQSLFVSQQDISAAHANDSIQSTQDTAGLEKITPASSASEVSEAADEALKHL